MGVITQSGLGTAATQAASPIILGEVSFQGRNYLAILHPGEKIGGSSLQTADLEQAKEKCCQIIQKVLMNTPESKMQSSHNGPQLEKLSAGGVSFSHVTHPTMLYSHTTLKTEELWNKLIYLTINPHHAKHVESQVEFVDISDITLQDRFTLLRQVRNKLGKTTTQEKIELTSMQAKVFKMLPDFSRLVEGNQLIIKNFEDLDEFWDKCVALEEQLKESIEKEKRQNTSQGKQSQHNIQDEASSSSSQKTTSK
ncbi:hypothetical protein [Rhabdochlamydiaceae symbiont of Dictyostelium giganteum]|uniref:hypothetical protein n=1 Tax=Rhabdochlamydiaceae symbiont of Dictyostelium giganteum TaxID=3342349 RepID=UPI00384F9BDA